MPTRLRILAARCARVVQEALAQKKRGRRECRVANAPAASCVMETNTRVSHHGHTGVARHSLHNGFTAYFVLSPAIGLFVTVAGGYLFRPLDAGVEAAETHALAVRKSGALVLALPASTASRPSSVTIAKRPSVGRDVDGYASDLGRAKTEIFLEKGLDRPSRKTRTDLPVGQNQIDRFTEFAERDDVSAAAVYSLAPHFAGRGLG